MLVSITFFILFFILIVRISKIEIHLQVCVINLVQSIAKCNGCW